MYVLRQKLSNNNNRFVFIYIVCSEILSSRNAYLLRRINVQLIQLDTLFYLYLPLRMRNLSICFASQKLIFISTSIFTASISTLDHSIFLSKYKNSIDSTSKKKNSSLRREITFYWQCTSKIKKFTITRPQFAAMMLC